MPKYSDDDEYTYAFKNFKLNKDGSLGSAFGYRGGKPALIGETVTATESGNEKVSFRNPIILRADGTHIGNLGPHVGFSGNDIPMKETAVIAPGDTAIFYKDYPSIGGDSFKTKSSRYRSENPHGSDSELENLVSHYPIRFQKIFRQFVDDEGYSVPDAYYQTVLRLTNEGHEEVAHKNKQDVSSSWSRWPMYRIEVASDDDDFEFSRTPYLDLLNRVTEYGIHADDDTHGRTAIVRAPISKLMSINDIANGYSGQRDSENEIVMREFTPIHEITPLEKKALGELGRIPTKRKYISPLIQEELMELKNTGAYGLPKELKDVFANADVTGNARNILNVLGNIGSGGISLSQLSSILDSTSTFDWNDIRKRRSNYVGDMDEMLKEAFQKLYKKYSDDWDELNLANEARAKDLFWNITAPWMNVSDATRKQIITSLSNDVKNWRRRRNVLSGIRNF